MSENDDKALEPKKGKGKGKTVLAYTTLEGADVRASVEQAGTLKVSELWPDLPRVEQDDLFEGPFFVCDARMLGQGSSKGEYYVAMIATGDGESDTPFVYSSTILGGKAVVRTMRDVMAHNSAGEPIPGKTPAIPVAVRLVEVQGENFPYFRLVPTNWEPDENTKVTRPEEFEVWK